MLNPLVSLATRLGVPITATKVGTVSVPAIMITREAPRRSLPLASYREPAQRVLPQRVVTLLEVTSSGVPVSVTWTTSLRTTATPTLRFRRETGADVRWKAVRFVGEAQTGDARFDAAVFLEGAEEVPAVVRRLVRDAGARAAILALLDVNATVVVEQGALSLSWIASADAQLPGLDAAAVSALVDRFAQLADALDEAGWQRVPVQSPAQRALWTGVMALYAAFALLGVFAWAADLDASWVRLRDGAAVGFGAWLVVCVLHATSWARTSRAVTLTAGAALLTVCWLPWCASEVGSAINRAADRARIESQVVDANVTATWDDDSREWHAALLRQDFTDDSDVIDATRRLLCAQHREGLVHARLTVHPGALGLRWIELTLIP